MSRYDNLREYLDRSDAEALEISFAEIEHILGFALPPSARRYQAWWANDPHHAQAKAWLGAGRRTARLSVADERVVFAREERAAIRRGASGFEEGQMNMVESHVPHPAIGSMKGMVTIMPGTDLTAPVDPEWVERLYDDKATAGDLVGGLDDPTPDRR